MTRNLYGKAKDAGKGAWAILVFIAALALTIGGLFSIYQPNNCLPLTSAIVGAKTIVASPMYNVQYANSAGVPGIIGVQQCYSVSQTGQNIPLFYVYNVTGQIIPNIQLYVTNTQNATVIAALNANMTRQVQADAMNLSGATVGSTPYKQIAAAMYALNSTIAYNRFQLTSATSTIPAQVQGSTITTTTTVQQVITPYTGPGILQQIQDAINNLLKAIGL